MTNNEILDLKAGLDMDAAVAEALGWKFNYSPGQYVAVEDDEGEYEVFAPSTDFRDAFRAIGAAIDRLPDTAKFVTQSVFPGSGDAPEYEAVLDEVFGDRLIRASGDTLPEAICRVVLLLEPHDITAAK